MHKYVLQFAICLNLMLGLSNHCNLIAQEKQELEELNEAESKPHPVELASEWLIKQQQADGSWTFADVQNPKQWTDANRMATAMSLLSLTNQGHTHKEGKYSKNVYLGFKWLLASAKDVDKQPNLKDFSDSDVGDDAHAWSALAICELYGLTKDKVILPYAQGSLDYTFFLQDTKQGGWSRKRGDPMQMTSTFLHARALYSGSLAYLTINPDKAKKIHLALDFLAVDPQALSFYGEDKPGKDAQATCLAINVRQRLGWKRDRAEVKTATEWLLQVELNKLSLLTILELKKLYSDSRERFDEIHKMLIDVQDKTSGSWLYADDPNSKTGGRLYCTNLAIQILAFRPRQWTVRKDYDGPFPL
jgi:hypothetical protein